MSLSLGPHGCCCAGGSASSSAHAARTEVSLQSGPVPTERPTGYGAGYQEVVGGPQMVEGAGNVSRGSRLGPVLRRQGYLWMNPLSSKAGAPAGLGQGQHINARQYGSRQNPAFLLKVVTDSHLNQSVELRSLRPSQESGGVNTMSGQGTQDLYSAHSGVQENGSAIYLFWAPVPG